MRNVLISLKGYNGTEEKLEFVTEGKYYRKNNNYYVIYNESEMTGMEGTITTVKVKGSVVSLIRHGAVTSNFVFEEGIANNSLYKTQFGEFAVTIKANRVNIDMDDDGGVIEMDYRLDLSDGNNIDNKFFMTVRGVKENEYNQ